jgi:uncharacterized RDD family membrane protein YckC
MAWQAKSRRISSPADLRGAAHSAIDLADSMKSRFQPDTECAAAETPRLIDPEGFDVSEQQFAASLEEKPPQPRPRFVLENQEPPANRTVADDGPSGTPPQNASLGSEVEPAVILDPSLRPMSEADSWRREVAARVNHYRGKRPRTPRYPSLQLKFEPAEPPVPTFPEVSQAREVVSRGQLAITMDLEPATMIEPRAAHQLHHVPTAAPSDGATNILEFPRSAFMPPVVVDELAEPVFDRPRILEVPEILPPPPALGGISIESTAEPEDDRRPGFELPLKSARLGRRILAGMTDAVVVAAAFAGFAYIFFRMTAIVPPLRQGVSVAAALLAVFWAAYQYLLLVHTGSTPGLKLARLELSRFDGSVVPRRLRRWRVLASVLSGLSLALGYVWCFMDEDELCWHDRITHTYMAPKAPKPKPESASH